MTERERKTCKTGATMRSIVPASSALRVAHRRSPIASRPSPARRAHAFTLLELLMVMSLIAVLASITLVVGRGINERSKVAHARAEMAALAAALEQYKQHYGDYPWTPDGTDGPAPQVDGDDLDGGAIMFNALCGNLGPKGAQLSAKGRTFIDLDHLTVASSVEARLPDDALPTLRKNWVNDPWGKWYYYYYKKGSSDAAWLSKGFLLYSHGPDQDCAPGPEEESGLVEDVTSDAVNADNIYHGRD